MHVRSTIKRNLTSSSWQTNARFLFLFQIKYLMYLDSRTVFNRMQFYFKYQIILLYYLNKMLISASSYKHLLNRL